MKRDERKRRDLERADAALDAWLESASDEERARFVRAASREAPTPTRVGSRSLWVSRGCALAIVVGLAVYAGPPGEWHPWTGRVVLPVLLWAIWVFFPEAMARFWLGLLAGGTRVTERQSLGLGWLGFAAIALPVLFFRCGA